MQDRPTAIELLRAAQDFCENDLQPALEGRLAFQVRVLRNVLQILEREWEGEDAALRAEWARLRDLLGKDGSEPPAEPSELRSAVHGCNTELAAAIRSGVFDERFEEALAALRPTVAEKLAIANPRWAGAARD